MTQAQEEIKMFLEEIRDPEGFGHAVTEEVRFIAGRLLKMLEAECKNS